MAAVEVNENSVRELADSGSFTRGQDYFADGRVRRLTVDGATVTAVVDGTHPYRVQLTVTRAGLRGDCSCPHGAEGFFCKHCVAAALAWLDRAGQPALARRVALPDKRLRSFLLSRDQTWLADQLLAAAMSDQLLRARLEVAAGADARTAFDDRELRERLELAIEPTDYVDFDAAHTYFHHINAALDELAAVAAGGFPDAAITLAEYARKLLKGADVHVEDLEGLDEAVARVEEIHVAARSTPPTHLASPQLSPGESTTQPR